MIKVVMVHDLFVVIITFLLVLIILFTGLLFGSYGTKRSVSVTDSVENNIQLEYKIKVVRYAGFKHQRPNSSNVLQYTPNKLQCLGMFVIKRDGSMLYPSFKDMTSLNEIISTRAKGNHSPSSQPILLMFSAPKTNDVKNDQSWIYDMKHTCYLYRNHAPTRFVLTKLNIPSLAPDVQSQFDEARGLGSCVDDCDVVWSGNHGSQHPNSISCGITSMAAAALAQVVDTELLMSDIIMSMQVRCLGTF